MDTTRLIGFRTLDAILGFIDFSHEIKEKLHRFGIISDLMLLFLQERSMEILVFFFEGY